MNYGLLARAHASSPLLSTFCFHGTVCHVSIFDFGLKKLSVQAALANKRRNKATNQPANKQTDRQTKLVNKQNLTLSQADTGDTNTGHPVWPGPTGRLIKPLKPLKLPTLLIVLAHVWYGMYVPNTRSCYLSGLTQVLIR